MSKIYLMFHDFMFSFHFFTFKLIDEKNEILNNNKIISMYSNYEFVTSIQIVLTLSQLFQSKL